MQREQMNIVIVGHVDHGKSTVIGRLLADTGSLPEGKLQHVQAMCAKNAKPFEYAFLLDALKDEQAQGITIDTARCFFKTARRNYIVLDAPGHIEFLKNMVTGAARAEAALLVIDAKEGIQENSKRHGYLMSMLGIRQISVLVNKMDLVEYSREAFQNIQQEYGAFLQQIGVQPNSFIPISARFGENLTASSARMPWYQGPAVLQQLDDFVKQKEKLQWPFRLPVQDIYKFTQENDDRRIVAGTVETGSIQVGDEVLFLPSLKRSVVKSIEAFNTPVKTTAAVGEAAGFTLQTQVYVKPGEWMVKAADPLPPVSTRFLANVFWIGKAPLIKNKTYKLKLTTSRAMARLVEIVKALDVLDLDAAGGKDQVDRHEIAQCVFETNKPVVFDLISEIETTSRFVLVDNYEIAGGGIILEKAQDTSSILHQHIRDREVHWQKSEITSLQREAVYGHKGKFIVFAGNRGTGKRAIAMALEKHLFEQKHKAYYLGIGNIQKGLDSDIRFGDETEEHIRRLGELARIMTDSGQIFITTISDIDDYDLEKIKLLNAPHELLVINVGENNFTRYKVDLELPSGEPPKTALPRICQLLKDREILPDYCI